MNPFTIALLAIIPITAPSPESIAAPATIATTAPASTRPTKFASRNIRVTFDQIGPDADRVITQISNRAAELAPKILGDAASGENRDWLKMEPVIAANYFELRISVDTSVNEQLKPAAREMADKLVESIQSLVRQEFDRQGDEQVQPLEEARAEAERRLQEVTREARALPQKMLEVSGRAEVSAKNVTEALTRLEEEKQKLELDLMGKAARRDALEHQIAEQSDRGQKKMADDAIAAELQKVVEAREAQVDRLKKMAQSAIASDSEVQEAIGKVAEARAKLLERKRDALAEAGGESLAAFNRELLSLSVDQKELAVRLSYIEKHLPGLREASDAVDEMERIEQDLAAARSDARSADTRLRGFRLKTARPPQLFVADSENRETKPAGNGLFGR